MTLNIIYEDNHIIVVEKPAGILSQAGSLDLLDMLTEIKAFLKEKYQKPGNVFLGLVHRLDTNVGGIMVFAKTSKAASRLSKEIRNHTFKKKYLAVVQGHMQVGKSHELIDYLSKDEEKKLAYITDQIFGKKSELNFEVLANKIINKKEYTLIDIKLETGRFHQIRAQLSKFGHPIYNDGKYGESIEGFNLGLFSYEISFIHPISHIEVKYHLMPKTDIFVQFKESIKILEEKL
jgi:23S rRNA pseudouridine1911/1915/1917 synthase